MMGDTLENKCLSFYRIIEGFIHEVNGSGGFKGQVKFSFPCRWPWPGLLIYHLKQLTPQLRDRILKTPFGDSVPLGLGISYKSCLLYLNFLLVILFIGYTVLWCLDYRAVLDFCIYGPDSWRIESWCYIQNQKGLGSNATRCLAESWNPNLIPGLG